jgi:3',5'-cyclic AMP phosphodiesterase CpdA
MIETLTRRNLLKAGLATAAASAIKPWPVLAADDRTASATATAFRFVHLTDIHIRQKRDGDKGFAKALQAVEALKPRPDFILTGGDLVFDVLGVNPAKARGLFDLYKKVIADNTSLPIYNTIGNHDVFGWSAKSKVEPTVSGYGKALVKDLLGMKETYHRFDHKGWRFFCLDNIQPGKRDGRYPYEGYIDETQRDWLKQELGRTPRETPIVVCEHIPTVTATQYTHEDLVVEKEWRVPSAYVCKDSPQRIALYRTRNVKLSLSGHIHERDRIEFQGTTFINDGAVCGSWWKGPHHGVEEGFGIIDAHANGTFDHQYFDYGWQAKVDKSTDDD